MGVFGTVVCGDVELDNVFVAEEFPQHLGGDGPGVVGDVEMRDVECESHTSGDRILDVGVVAQRKCAVHYLEVYTVEPPLSCFVVDITLARRVYRIRYRNQCALVIPYVLSQRFGSVAVVCTCGCGSKQRSQCRIRCAPRGQLDTVEAELEEGVGRLTGRSTL
jgi:hypothetical protein